MSSGFSLSSAMILCIHAAYTSFPLEEMYHGIFQILTEIIQILQSDRTLIHASHTSAAKIRETPAGRGRQGYGA